MTSKSVSFRSKPKRIGLESNGKTKSQSASKRNISERSRRKMSKKQGSNRPKLRKSIGERRKRDKSKRKKKNRKD